LLKKSLFNTFKEIGRDIFLRGLISSHAGNMSSRTGDKIHITRRGSMLGQLKPADIIELDLEKNDPNLLLMASSEVPVHKAIYKYTSALAIIHAHPPYATLLSMIEDELIPLDWEGSYLLEKVPVVTMKKTIGTEETANIVSGHLKDYKIILMRGHGSFARGSTLEDAYMLTSSLESSSFFLYHLKGKDKEYRKFSDKYKNR
jgi:L-fuculose-phosphate aldolase